jgi:phospholipid transport system substrate-binding protein
MTNAALSRMTRRALLVNAAAAIALFAAAPAAFAVGLAEAEGLVDRLVADVNAVIASGKSESAMLSDFEAIFEAYADVPTIARYSLGNDARSASSAQLSAYTDAFSTYIARKYGRRFREFIGGRIEVIEARNVPNGVEVETTAILVGESPFRVDFWVSDASGRTRFFNIIIEGVNMLLSERTEIQAMLDQRGGDIDRLIADLPQA